MSQIYSKVKLKKDRFKTDGIGIASIGYLIEDYKDGHCEAEFSNSYGISIAQIDVSLEDFEFID